MATIAPAIAAMTHKATELHDDAANTVPTAFPIVTQRLEIRPFTVADVPAYALILAKPEVTRYLGTGAPTPPGESESRAARWISMWQEAETAGLGVFAVFERESGDLIGHCGFTRVPDGRVEIDYAFDSTAWGKGYGTEAARTMLEYGREHLGVTELIGMAYPENSGSIGIFRKLGMSRFGTEHHHGSDLEIYECDLRRLSEHALN